jgi:hypothetical protein
MQLRDAASLMKAFHHYRDETRKRFDAIVDAAARG